VKVKAAANALAAERRPLGAGGLGRERGTSFSEKGSYWKILDGTSLDHMRGSLALEFSVMSRARARLNSKVALLKRTRRPAEVVAFDVGRPPPLHWTVPTGNQVFCSVSSLPVRNQAGGGPGPGESGHTVTRFYLRHQGSVYRPCSPQAYGRRGFCCPYFRATAGARRVPVEYSNPVLAAHRGMVKLSAIGVSEISFRSRSSVMCCDISHLMCLCT